MSDRITLRTAYWAGDENKDLAQPRWNTPSNPIPVRAYLLVVPKDLDSLLRAEHTTATLLVGRYDLQSTTQDEIEWVSFADERESASAKSGGAQGLTCRQAGEES